MLRKIACMSHVVMDSQGIRIEIADETASPLSRCQVLTKSGKWTDVLLPSTAALHTAPPFPQFGNPILFPVAGRSYGHDRSGVAVWEREEFSMPLHGIGYPDSWRTQSSGDVHSTQSKLEYEPSRKQDWPFPCELIQTFTITDEKTLQHRVTVKNLHTSRHMPLALGFHPFFTFPKSSEAIYLRHQARTFWSVNHKGLASNPSPRKTEESLLTSSEVANGIYGDLSRSCFDILNARRNTLLNVSWDASDFSFLTCWSNPEQGIWCVEPWQNVPNPWQESVKPMLKVAPQNEIDCQITMRWYL